MQRFNDFYNAFHFLRGHEMCCCKPYINGEIFKYPVNYFNDCLDIYVAKVNPETLIEEDDKSLNTKTQVWLEFGSAFLDLDDNEKIQFEHDYNLDCGADTFEEAIIILANLVDKYYNDDGTIKEMK